MNRPALERFRATGIGVKTGEGGGTWGAALGARDATGGGGGVTFRTVGVPACVEALAAMVGEAWIVGGFATRFGLLLEVGVSATRIVGEVPERVSAIRSSWSSRPVWYRVSGAFDKAFERIRIISSGIDGTRA